MKLLIHLEKRLKKITKIKRKKLWKLSGEEVIKELLNERFNCFDYFSKYCETFSPDFTNIANLVTLENSFNAQKLF